MMSLQVINQVLLPFYAVVVLFGIPGNVLFIAVVKRTRVMHSTTNFLLANIAIADIISLIVCIPGVILQFIDHPKGDLGSFLCKFVTMHHVAGVTLLVSGFTLTVISVDRHNVLLRPMDESIRLRKKHAKFAIGLIWIFSIALVIPLFVKQHYVEEVNNCHMDWKATTSKAYWGILAVLVMLSLLVMSVCYFRIVKSILSKELLAENRQEGSTPMWDEDNKSKRKLVRLLVSVTVIFIMCFVPFTCVSAMSISTSTLSYKVPYFLVYFSCSVNPVVYIIQSSNYRTGIKYLFANRRRVHAIKESIILSAHVRTSKPL